MLNITFGRVARPQKLVLYGVEGIGKTSLAAQTPEPLFIDTEGGTSHLDVRRLQKPASWEELISLIREVAATPDVCRTLVIDTADWAEQLCIDHICAKYKQPGIESFGYGKGYTYLAEEFARMLTACDEVISSPASTRRSVLFPAPFSPTRPTRSPSYSSNRSISSTRRSA